MKKEDKDPVLIVTETFLLREKSAPCRYDLSNHAHQDRHIVSLGSGVNGTGLSPISITEALHGKGFVAMARPCDLPHQNEFNDIPKSFGSRRDLSWLNEKPLNPVPFGSGVAS